MTDVVTILSTANSVLDQLTLMAPKVIAACAALATLIPQSGKFSNAIHLLAFNFGYASNKNDG